MILFLDFDGVLHPETFQSGTQLLSRLPLVEEVLREYPLLALVISSAWRLRYKNSESALAELKLHFSPDIAERVVGVTPDYRNLDENDAPDGLSGYVRHWECLTWMRKHRYPGTPWMALDDRAYLFRPFTENLMVLNNREAFTKNDQPALRAYLHELHRFVAF